jgi:hypothetical protein
MNNKMFPVLALGLLAMSADAAVVLTPDLNGDFTVSTPNNAFTPWAEAGGAVTVGSFGTYGTGYGVQSGATASSSSATLTIPFAAQVGYQFDTAILDLSAAIWNIGADTYTAPAVSVSVNVNGVETKVFEWVSAEKLPEGSAVQFNYAGAAPAESFYGQFSTTVDLSTLVSGASSFELSFQANQAWPVELGYGGAFYQDSSTPFSLSGQLSAVPEPQMAVLALVGCASLLIRRRMQR